MIHKFFVSLDNKFQFKQARAHCDVPCGIYDPAPAQIAALTVVRMLDLMAGLQSGDDKSKSEYHNSMSRYIAVKEEHAEKAKHEIRVIWGDYFKKDKHPNVDDLVQRIMQLGSKCRQTSDREAGLAFVDAINEFAVIFWESKGITVKRAKAPYAPALEMVYPNL